MYQSKLILFSNTQFYSHELFAMYISIYIQIIKAKNIEIVFPQ